jgi:hypothetical protein
MLLFGLKLTLGIKIKSFEILWNSVFCFAFTWAFLTRISNLVICQTTVFWFIELAISIVSLGFFIILTRYTRTENFFWIIFILITIDIIILLGLCKLIFTFHSVRDLSLRNEDGNEVIVQPGTPGND